MINTSDTITEHDIMVSYPSEIIEELLAYVDGIQLPNGKTNVKQAAIDMIKLGLAAKKKAEDALKLINTGNDTHTALTVKRNVTINHLNEFKYRPSAVIGYLWFTFLSKHPEYVKFSDQYKSINVDTTQHN